MRINQIFTIAKNSNAFGSEERAREITLHLASEILGESKNFEGAVSKMNELIEESSKKGANVYYIFRRVAEKTFVVPLNK